MYLAIISNGNKSTHLRLYPIFLSGKNTISHAMPAGILVQLRFRRLPPRIPDSTPIVNIIIMPPCIIRHIIITIPGQPQKPGIFIKTIPPACIGNQREKILAPQIIDPGQRRFRLRNHIFPVPIIKIPILHRILHSRLPYRQINNKTQYPKKNSKC